MPFNKLRPEKEAYRKIGYFLAKTCCLVNLLIWFGKDYYINSRLRTSIQKWLFTHIIKTFAQKLNLWILHKEEVTWHLFLTQNAFLMFNVRQQCKLWWHLLNYQTIVPLSLVTNPSKMYLINIKSNEIPKTSVKMHPGIF